MLSQMLVVMQISTGSCVLLLRAVVSFSGCVCSVDSTSHVINRKRRIYRGIGCRGLEGLEAAGAKRQTSRRVGEALECGGVTGAVGLSSCQRMLYARLESDVDQTEDCLLYTSPSPRDAHES
eukprot:3394810-Prymnesium_polylepis.1